MLDIIGLLCDLIISWTIPLIYAESCNPIPPAVFHPQFGVYKIKRDVYKYSQVRFAIHPLLTRLMEAVSFDVFFPMQLHVPRCFAWKHGGPSAILFSGSEYTLTLFSINEFSCHTPSQCSIKVEWPKYECCPTIRLSHAYWVRHFTSSSVLTLKL